MSKETRVIALRRCIFLGFVDVAKYFVEAGEKYEIFNRGNNDSLIKILIDHIRAKTIFRGNWQALIKNHLDLSDAARANAIKLCNQLGDNLTAQYFEK